jgi:hypothetical protein
MAKSRKNAFDATAGGLMPGVIEGGGVRVSAGPEGRPTLELLASGRKIDLESLADLLGAASPAAAEPEPEAEAPEAASEAGA